MHQIRVILKQEDHNSSRRKKKAQKLMEHLFQEDLCCLMTFQRVYLTVSEDSHTCMNAGLLKSRN